MRSLQEQEQLEIDLLLEGIHRCYGYNFKQYSSASLKRRLLYARQQAGVTTFTEFLDKLIHSDNLFDQFLRHMSVTVTAMFRDPDFYRTVRQKIIPIFKTFPFVKIWHAGCATGEEVYSMAILLHEENFLDRARLYATDFNKNSLDVAQKAVYASNRVENYSLNYKNSGGSQEFSDYYQDGYELIKFKDFLKERITFSYHNLVTDGVFGEMNLIFCRNVLIYFDQKLQARALTLFSESLRYGGFLCLGNKESLNFMDEKFNFETIDSKQKIYKKLG